MTRLFIGLALGVGLTACGGGTPPFGTATTTQTDGSDGTGAIPTELANDLESFTYSPSDQTLVIRGVSLEDGPFEDVYRRRPGLDRGEYQAFTAQDGSLDRHSTAYVRDIRGTRAAIAVTGGQFRYFFAGGAYSNGGDYAPPVEPGATSDGGLVTYGGNYVGVFNAPGTGEDLTPVTPGTPGSFRPSQGAEVTGRILINASFSDGTVNGIVAERFGDGSLVPGLTGELADLELAPTAIEADGTFFGETTVDLTNRGEYGGIFGGDGATEVAGIVHATEHVQGVQNIEEYGVFVLAQCGTPEADIVCDQPVP